MAANTGRCTVSDDLAQRCREAAGKAVNIGGREMRRAVVEGKDETSVQHHAENVDQVSACVLRTDRGARRLWRQDQMPSAGERSIHLAKVVEADRPRG